MFGEAPFKPGAWPGSTGASGPLSDTELVTTVLSAPVPTLARGPPRNGSFREPTIPFWSRSS